MNADEMERKAMLVSTLNDTIKVRGLTQIQAAEIVGIDQPTLSKLLRGRFRSISIDELAEMLNALGRDVTIVVEAMPLREDTRGCELMRSAKWPQHDCLKEITMGGCSSVVEMRSVR